MREKPCGSLLLLLKQTTRREISHIQHKNAAQAMKKKKTFLASVLPNRAVIVVASGTEWWCLS